MTLSWLEEDEEGMVTDQLWFLGYRMLHDPALNTSNGDVNFVLRFLHRVDGCDAVHVSGVPDTSSVLKMQTACTNETPTIRLHPRGITSSKGKNINN